MPKKTILDHIALEQKVGRDSYWRIFELAEKDRRWVDSIFADWRK